MTSPRPSRRFLIPSLLAAGFGTQDGGQSLALTHVTSTGTDDPNKGSLFRAFKQDHMVTLAQHRSHSSHSSHSSHRSSGGGHYSHSSHTSHRSSTGGYEPVYTTPVPLPAPAPPPPPPPVGPEVPRSSTPPGQLRATPPSDAVDTGTALPALSGRSQRFAAIVRRVQIALLAQGFFEGPITGAVGPVTRAGLRRFQSARRLSVTGTITPETLDALRVSSE